MSGWRARGPGRTLGEFKSWSFGIVVNLARKPGLLAANPRLWHHGAGQALRLSPPMESTTPMTLAPTDLEERLADLWELTADESLHRLSAGRTPEGHRPPQSEQERQDLVSSCLMDCYRNTREPRVFAMLFELNQAAFLQAIQAKVRRSAGQVDPQDVLQEVFLNIYRYPRRFLCERSDSFRNWGHRIVRNTLLKFFKAAARLQRCTPLDEDVGQRSDPHVRSPFRCALEGESAKLVDFAYLVYLNLYLVHYRRLSQKEQRALRMVEVDGASYKETAAALGIRLENLKMVIFRGRRKIFRGLQKSLSGLASPPPGSRQVTSRQVTSGQVTSRQVTSRQVRPQT